jgi:hypothetical protein
MYGLHASLARFLTMMNNIVRRADSLMKNKWAWAVATLGIISCLAPGIPAGSQALNSGNLDLSSTTHAIPAANSGVLRIAGTNLRVTPGQLLTVAESLALQQIMQTGRQQLVIGRLGNAVAGTLNLGTVGNSQLASLTVPRGVTVLRDFGVLGALNLTGNFANAGSLFAFSTNPQTATASISTLNLSNMAGGLISSVLPKGTFGMTGLVNGLSLNLSAANNIVNAGIIRSAGDLSLCAGNLLTNSAALSLHPLLQSDGNLNLTGAGIVNTGTINSLAGNINVSGLNASNLVINNVRGTFEARSGSINLGDALNTAKTNLQVLGGNFLSQQLNLYSGKGNVEVSADDISGVVNVQAGNAHVLAATPNLRLGQIDLTGDPTFYNTNGSIAIENALVFSGQDLAIVAAGSITSGAGLSIDTSSAAGNGGSITMVAGANFNTSGASSLVPPSGAGDTSSVIVIKGGSATGGKIDLATYAIGTLNSNSSFSGGSGGNLTMVAFAGTAADSGRILLPVSPSFAVNTQGNGAANGNVTMIAGSNTPSATISNVLTSTPAISVGNITASGGGSGGNILLSAATPNLPTPVTIMNGKLEAGLFLPGKASKAGVTVGSPVISASPVTGTITSDGSFTVNTGGLFDGSNSNITASNNIKITSAGANINTLTSSAGSINVASSGGSQIVLNSKSVPAATPVGINTSGPVTANSDITMKTTANNGNIILQGNVVATNGRVVMQAHGSGNITTINRVVATITDGTNWSFLQGATVSPDGNYLYVPDRLKGTVSIVSTASNSVVKTLSGLVNPQASAISADGLTLYVTGWTGNIVSVISTGGSDPSSAAISSTINLPTFGPGTTRAEAVAVNPHNPDLLYVLCDNSPASNVDGAAVLYIYDNVTTSPSLASTIPLGLAQQMTGGLVVNPQGTVAFASCFSSRQVFAVDLNTNSIISTINLDNIAKQLPNVFKAISPAPPAGLLTTWQNLGPISLAIDPSGSQLYVAEAYMDNIHENIQGGVVFINALPNSSKFGTLSGGLAFPSELAVSVGSYPQGISVNATGTELTSQLTYLSHTLNSYYVSILYANSTPAPLNTYVAAGRLPGGYGSSAFSTILTTGGVANLTSYTSNTNDLTGIGSISVIQEPTIKAGSATGSSISLSTTTGLILASVDSSGGYLTVNSGGTGGVVISDVGSKASSIGACSSKGLFEVGSTQPLTITGAINSPRVILQTVTGKSITQMADIGQSGGTVTINAGSLVGILGTITGSQVTLNGITGDIGASGASIRIKTGQLTAVTAGTAKVYLGNTGALTLLNSAAGNSFNLYNAGAITMSSTTRLLSPNVYLTTSSASNGNITVGAQVGIDLSSGNLIQIMAGGTGSVKTAAANALIKGQGIFLVAGGNIGTNTQPLPVSCNGLAVNSTGTGGGFVSVSGVSNCNLSTSVVGGALSIAGTDAAGTSITLGGNLVGSSITLKATGAIINMGGYGLEAPSVSVTSTYTGGGTGADIGSAAKPIFTTTSALTVNTAGSAYVTAATSPFAGYVISLNASSVGTAMYLDSSAPIVVKGVLNSPVVQLRTLFGTNAGITLSANVGVSGTGTTTLVADGNITQTTGNILSNVVILDSAQGNIGASATTPIKLSTKAATTTLFRANAGQNAFVSNNGALTIAGTSGAGGTFQVVNGGTLTIAAATTADILTLQTSSNNNIAVQHNVRATTSVALTAGGTGSINRDAGVVEAPIVTLVSSGGNIGDFGTSKAFFVGGGTVTAKTTGAGGVFLAFTTAESIGASSTASSSSFKVYNIVGNVNPYTVVGNISSGDITLVNNQPIFVNANLSSGGNILIQNITEGSLISFANAAQVTTLVPATATLTGKIDIFVGSTPAQQSGTFPGQGTSIIVNTKDGGQAYPGTRPSAISPPATGVATIDAFGRNVRFDSSGAYDNTILLGPGVLIKADPPSPGQEAAMLSTSNPTSSRSFSATAPASTAAAQLSTLGNLTAQVQPAVMVPAQLSASLARQALPQEVLSEIETREHVQRLTNLTAQNHTLSNTDTTAQKQAVLPPANAAIENGRTAALNQVIYATEKTVLNLHGIEIRLAAGSITYLVMEGCSVSVFDLHDSHAGSVVLSHAGHVLRLHPGSMATALVLPQDSNLQFGDVNPLPQVGYRNVTRTVCSKGMTFAAEFSTISALSLVDSLSRLRHSTNAQERACLSNILKTSASLLTVKSSQPYRLIPRQTLAMSEQ